MNIEQNVYSLNNVSENENNIRFFFFSEGNQRVLKIIDFAKVGYLEDQALYNLGFGDYNFEEQTLNDNILSANGDNYKVLNTVLSAIPIFFKQFPNAILMVQGSDSTIEFNNWCKSNCIKGCTDICKNKHRRINLYKNFLDKNFNELSKEYRFFQGLITDDNQLIKVNYTIKNEGKIVLVAKNV